MIKYIITGTRDLQQPEQITSILNHYLTQYDPNQVMLIHGGCRGVDLIARDYAISLDVDVKEYKPNWSRYGRAAGPIRNKQMLEDNPDATVLAFPAPKSKGTVDCINQARKRNMKVDVYMINNYGLQYSM